MKPYTCISEHGSEAATNEAGNKVISVGYVARPALAAGRLRLLADGQLAFPLYPLSTPVSCRRHGGMEPRWNYRNGRYSSYPFCED